MHDLAQHADVLLRPYLSRYKETLMVNERLGRVYVVEYVPAEYPSVPNERVVGNLWVVF